MSTTIKRFGLNFRSNRKQSCDLTSNLYGSESSYNCPSGKQTNSGSHELDEIAIVSTSNANPSHVRYGNVVNEGSFNQSNVPKIVPGIVSSTSLSIQNDRNKGIKSTMDHTPVRNKYQQYNNYDVHPSKQSRLTADSKQPISNYSNYKLEIENEAFANALLASNLSSYHYSPSPSVLIHNYNDSEPNSEADLLMLSSQNTRHRPFENLTIESINKSSRNQKSSEVCRLKIPSLTLTNSTGDIPLLEDNNFRRPMLSSSSSAALHHCKKMKHPTTSQGNHHSHHLSHIHLPAPHYLQSMSHNKLNSQNHLNSSNSSCTGLDRYKKINDGNKIHTKWSFVFDPAGRLCYYWYMIVSLAFLYNFWVIIYRFAFQEINSIGTTYKSVSKHITAVTCNTKKINYREFPISINHAWLRAVQTAKHIIPDFLERNTLAIWFCFDYFSDFLYVIDILFHFRMGYLEDGVLQTDPGKLRNHYMNSTTFYIDCLCLLPFDFLYLSIGFNSVLRSFRLVKVYRFWAFMDRTERHTNYPNLFRSISLIHYLLIVYHWNACFYYIVYKNNGFGSRNWVYHDNDHQDIIKQYLQSYYWCTLALTTIGGLPKPRTNGEYAFIIFQLLLGLFLLATVLGHVFNIVTSVSAARKEFQAKLDGVKTYMRLRHVPTHLQTKVIKWFDYLWLTQKCSDEEKAISCLPDKLKAEIAINVHLDTLKRVEIFQNTEAGFLCELVLRLRPVLFSPGDYICRKGEVGKEMYIVNRGRLQVVADNGRIVLATLKAGSYFGEISILNMGTAGNRRTASVRSVGYSDLFVLSKKDLWDVLKEYPAARVRLEAIAVKRLDKYKKAPLQKAAMGRSYSTPGLVESKGRISLEEMWIPNIPLNIKRPSFASNSSSVSSNQSSKFEIKNEQINQNQNYRNKNVPQKESKMISSNLEAPLESEIRVLRKRLQTVEMENAEMSLKLLDQQRDLQKKLREIESKIEDTRGVDTSKEGDAATPDNSGSSLEDNERNRESFI